MHDFLEKTFRLSESHTTIRTEILAGVTTFMTMSYIIFVQPAVLSTTGMDFQAVLASTCIVSAIGCFLMALLANYPIAVAPAMGHNFFFAFTVVATMHYTWQVALGAVFISGVAFLLMSFWGRVPCRNCDEHGFGSFLWYRAFSRHLQLSTLHYACCTEAGRRRSLQARSNSGNFHFFLSRSLRQHWIVDRHCRTGGIYP